MKSFFIKYKTPTMIILLVVVAGFIWQYNLRPMSINAQLVLAEAAVNQDRCTIGLDKIEGLVNQHSILDARVRFKYVELMRICAASQPEYNLAFAKKGIVLMDEAVKIQPLFSRLWIFLGGFTIVEASLEKDATMKAKALQKADAYFKKAEELAPDHQELFFERAKYYMIAEQWQNMKNISDKCVAIYPMVGNCYFLRAISHFYLHNDAAAQEDLQLAKDHNIDIRSVNSLNQLVNVYANTGNYQALADAYKELIYRKPKIAEYHASLAFTYKELGQYQNARQEALLFLTMIPKAKEEVEAFLKTLPQ